jgi:dihydrofolate reductase
MITKNPTALNTRTIEILRAQEETHVLAGVIHPVRGRDLAAAASTTLKSPEWNNTTVIEGDVTEAVARLKQEDGRNIMINGSGALIRTLMRDHLLDELRLFLHPIVVGSGIRLFESESDPVELALTDSHVYDNGVVSLTYGPSG